MSVVHTSIDRNDPWWRPFHLWRQLGAAAGLAVLCGFASSYLIEFSLIPAVFPENAEDGVLVFVITYLGPAILALLVFDGCWLAGLMGASWTETLFMPLKARFWRFAFAWVLIDLLFFGAQSALQAMTSPLEKMDAEHSALGWTIVALALIASKFSLLWIRLRLILWPVHVFVTGRLLDLTPAWQATTSPNKSLLEISVGLAAAALVLVGIGIFSIAFAYDYIGLIANRAYPLVLIAPCIFFRALQLSAFFDSYKRKSGIRLDEAIA